MNIPEMLKYKADSSANQPHERIVKALVARFDMSTRAMSQRYDAWKRSEEDLRAYTPESTEDSRRKSRRAVGEIHYTTLTVPLTYAMAMTAHTYWSAVFFNRSPVFQLGARHGLTEEATQPMEALLDYQLRVGRLQVPLMLWLMDPPRYGIGR